MIKRCGDSILLSTLSGLILIMRTLPWQVSLLVTILAPSSSCIRRQRGAAGQLGYHCQYCDSQFASLDGLKRHLPAAHSFRQCPNCHQNYPCNHMFERHLSVCHPNVPLALGLLFFCQTCSQDHPSQVKLDLHMKAAHALQSCPFCTQKYRSQLVLGEHITVAHPTAHLSMSGSSSSPLNCHLNTVHTHAGTCDDLVGTVAYCPCYFSD